MNSLCSVARFARKYATGWIASIVTILALTAPLVGDETEKTPAEKKVPPHPLGVETRSSDGTTLKATLHDQRVELVTPFGKLQIPVKEIQRIELGLRISADEAERIEVAIANLGSAEFRLREGASNELLKLREKAYPALVRAVKSTDQEVVRRAEGILDKLRSTMPEEEQEFRDYDVVITAQSKIAGKISGPGLTATT